MGFRRIEGREKETRMQRQTTEVLYFETSRHNDPTMRVRLGEVFEVQTQMNAGPWLDDHPDGEMLRKKLRGGNPSSGCIHVEGVEPGQVVSVHIEDVRLDEVGYSQFSPRINTFPNWLGNDFGTHHRIVRIEDGWIHWSDSLKLPAKPMVGFVGVAPAHEAFANAWGGTWGGNLDVPEVTTGAAVHLVVNVPGALLHVGDVHAIQGDGEICGAGGVETSALLRLRCEVDARPERMTWPRITTDEYISVVGNARPAEDSFRLALQDLIYWMVDDCGFAMAEAWLLLGQVLEARMTAIVNPTYSYIAKIRREYLRPWHTAARIVLPLTAPYAF